VCDFRGDVGAIKKVDSLIQKTQIIPQIRVVQPGDVFEDTTFKLGVEIVKF
jgi:hypothetical protein